MKYNIGDWTIVASIDEDKHLTLSVENSDNSRVIIMNSDIGEKMNFLGVIGLLLKI